MSKKQMTLVYYYVPEDQDDPQYPNVFGIMMSKANIRLQHIYDHFPLKGSYIFRFKVMYDNAVAWLDLPDLNAKLPTFKDRIFVKATRVSWQSGQPYGHYKTAVKNEGNLKIETPKQNGSAQKPKVISQSKKPIHHQVDLIGGDPHHHHGGDSLI